MNEIRYEAEIACPDGAPTEVVRERVYGNVRVIAEWPEELSTPEIRVVLAVTGDTDWRDAPGYIELFFHDVFLLLNLAAPGSFGGTISTGGGELRVRELSFSPRLFEVSKGQQTLPLAQVTAWYDALQLGTQQVATGGVAAALFQLLHLAREEEDEEYSILRLASAVEALLGKPDSLQRLFELRDAIANGRTPVYHPMYDDALDPQVEDATAEWIELADEAAGTVVRALQEQIMRLVVSG